MNVILSRVVKSRRDAVIDQVRLDVVEVFLSQRRFHLSGTGVSIGSLEGRMFLTKATSQKLGAQHVGVIQNREDLCLVVHVITRSNSMTTSDNPQSVVLNRL